MALVALSSGLRRFLAESSMLSWYLSNCGETYNSSEQLRSCACTPVILVVSELEVETVSRS